jgi:hypothetical protein
MLKQTVESTDPQQVLNFGGRSALVNLGSYSAVKYRPSTGAEKPVSLAFELGWRNVLPDTSIQVSPKNRFIGNQVEWSLNAGFSEISRSGRKTLVVQKLQFKSYLGSELSEVTRFTAERTNRRKSSYNIEFGANPGIVIDGIGSTAKFYRLVVDETSHQELNAFATLGPALLDLLFYSTHYLGPLRVSPELAYTWTGAVPSNVGIRGEKAVDAILAEKPHNVNSSDKLGEQTQTSVQKRVSTALRDLGVVERFRIKELAKATNVYQALAMVSQHSPEVLIGDIGFGVSQVFPVVVQLHYVPSGSLVLLEHPELHLHPKAQAELADLIIDVVQQRKLQVVIESHSEYFLTRLQRRMAEHGLGTEHEIDSKDMALYFCRLENGESKLEELKLNEFGSITNWPDEFFGNPFEERSAMLDAEMERRQQQKGAA